MKTKRAIINLDKDILNNYKKSSRELEIELHNKIVSLRSHIEKNKKRYDRDRDKKSIERNINNNNL